MPTNHVTKQIEAYLENRLSAEERQLVEEHLVECPACAYRLYSARRITNELGPVLKKALGQPLPPSVLQQRVRQALQAQQNTSLVRFPWVLSGRIINAAGTLVVVGVLSFGILAIIQSQSAAPEISLARPVVTVSTGSAPQPTRTPPPRPAVVALSPQLSGHTSNSLGETLIVPSTQSTAPEVAEELVRASSSPVSEEATPVVSKSIPQSAEASPVEENLPSSPPGRIAFTFFNTDSKIYEIHLINPDGTDRQRFPLDGVSEPALARTESGSYQIAYRAWGEPTTPRALAVNTLSAEQPIVLTNFWEDAQPDWSPTEPRLIFASQRESDRYWRLYTVWHDGSAEKDLRREGKSPSFAPDGYRFAFEGCDQLRRDERCGLWVGDLANSEQESKPVLLDAWAQSPDWSPVGEEIVYMSKSNDNWDIYLTDSKGRHPRRLTDDLAADGLPVWSPDGRWLAFLSNRDNHWGIWLLEIENLEVQPLVTFNEGHFSPPQRPPYEERHWWDEQLSWSN